jgi:hypothetical protein
MSAGLELFQVDSDAADMQFPFQVNVIWWFSMFRARALHFSLTKAFLTFLFGIS